jgi:hypothetical protein
MPRCSRCDLQLALPEHRKNRVPPGTSKISRLGSNKYVIEGKEVKNMAEITNK